MCAILTEVYIGFIYGIDLMIGPGPPTQFIPYMLYGVYDWGLRVSFICIVVGQGNPTRGLEIILVGGWDFLVPQQYIMMDTFSRPVCDFLRFNVNSVSSA